MVTHKTNGGNGPVDQKVVRCSREKASVAQGPLSLEGWLVFELAVWPPVKTCEMARYARINVLVVRMCQISEPDLHSVEIPRTTLT